MRKLLSLLLVGLLTAGFMAACGDDGDSIDVDGGRVTSGGDLPDDFPDDFPIYDGADLEGTFEADADEDDGAFAGGDTVVWSTGDDIEDVIAFYDDAFEEGPWTASSTSSFGGSGTWTVEKEGDDRVASVVVGEADGDVSIVVGLVDDAATGSGGTGDDDEDSSGDDEAEDEDADAADESEDDATDDEDSSADDEAEDEDSDDSASQPDAELPDEVEIDDEFPTDRVPLPDDARVTGSSSFGSGESTTYFVEFYSEDDVETVADHFTTELPANGWEEGFESTADGTVFLTYSEPADPSGTATPDSVSVSVAPAEVEGYTLATVTVSVTEEP